MSVRPVKKKMWMSVCPLKKQNEDVRLPLESVRPKKIKISMQICFEKNFVEKKILLTPVFIFADAGLK